MAAFRFLLLSVCLVPVAAGGQTSAPTDSATVAPVPEDTADVPGRPPDSMMQGALPELRVIGRPGDARPSTATPVTTLDLESREARAGRSVSDLLAAQTTLFVKQYGPGGLATASLRGLGSSQALVLIDGHRLADPQTGQTDLSLVPSLLLESARVRHGSHGAQYGSGTLGGVIQLETIRPSAPLRVEVMGGMGAFGWHTASGLLSGAGNQWSGLLAVEASGLEGNFPYENGTLVPPQTRRRENAQRQHRTTFGKVTHDGHDGRSSVSLWLNHVDRGLPGPATGSTSKATQTDTQWRLSGRHRHDLPTGTFEVTARGQRSTLRYRNPEALLVGSRTDTSRTYRASLNVSAHLPFRRNLLVETGVTGGYDWAEVRGGIGRRRVGAYVDATWSPGSVTLHPGLRLDANQSSDERRAVASLNPQLGVTWQPGPSWLRLKGQVGRSYRVPTFNERFFVPGGNPDLQAESGWSAEGGAVLHVRTKDVRFETEATVFATRLHDQIVWQPSYVGPGLQIWRPSNQSEVYTRGVEWTATGRWHPRSRFEARGRVTFSHVIATDQSLPTARSYGQQLPYTPRQRLKVQIGLDWGPARLDANTRLVSPRSVTADETQALPPYQVTNVGIQARRGVGPASITARIDVRNAFDEAYHVVRLYPMPPRHLRAQLTLSFP